jgi:hypothetical protein
MNIKDHPLIAVIVACSAVSATTWTVSENVRVGPVEKEKEALQNENIALKENNAELSATISALD